MNQFKIALFCDFLNNLGGTEYYNVVLATELKKRGFDICLFIGEKTRRNQYLDILEDNGIKFFESSEFHIDYSDRSIERKFVVEILDYFNTWKPDVIHASPAGKLIVAFLENKKHPHIPIVATEYTTPSIETAHWYPSDLDKYVNEIDAFIATCKASARGIRSFHKYKNEIQIIRHLIKKIKLKKTKCIKNSVGCVARLSAEKGIDFLLGAWKLVVKRISDATLHIYGHGPDDFHLENMVKALGLSDNVYFHGTFEPKFGIGVIADRHKIFVQPSLFESIPTSLIELMGCGRAIIATNVGGVGEVINKDTGILLKCASTDKLANAIIHLLKNSKLQNKYAKNAQKLFDTNYSLDVNVNRTIELYKSVILKDMSSSKLLYWILFNKSFMTGYESQLLIDSSLGILPEKFDFETFYIFYKFFELIVLNEVMEISPITLTGYHGIEHTRMVGMLSLELAIALNQNPIPSLFAAALHDCARSNNNYDEVHGLNAVPIARKLFKRDVSLFLSKAERKQIIEAIKNHTIGMNAKDVVSAILWDADRIRLSWDRGYRPEFFSTEPGKFIASMSTIKRKKFFNKFNRLSNKLKKEIEKGYRNF